MTLADVQAHQAKVRAYRTAELHADPITGLAFTAKAPRAEYVPISIRKRQMNGLETAFSQQLEFRKRAGELIWWAFEPVRIRLADGTYYTPDFVSVDAEGRTEVWETKGLMREAARVRLNVAADLLPWKFWLVRKIKYGDGFTVKPVSSGIGTRGT